MWHRSELCARMHYNLFTKHFKQMWFCQIAAGKEIKGGGREQESIHALANHTTTHRCNGND